MIIDNLFPKSEITENLWYSKLNPNFEWFGGADSLAK